MPDRPHNQTGERTKEPFWVCLDGSTRRAACPHFLRSLPNAARRSPALRANCRNKNRFITGTCGSGQEHARGACNALLTCAASTFLEGIMKTSLCPAATPSPQRRSRPRINDRPYPKTRPSGQHPRRRFLALTAGAVALPAASRIVWAQTYPTRPITMIVPFPAGGGTDAVGRIVAERMRVSLGQPVAATIGVGSAQHVGSIPLQKMTDTRFQFVPYRGSAPAMQDLLAGHVDWTMGGRRLACRNGAPAISRSMPRQRRCGSL